MDRRGFLKRFGVAAAGAAALALDPEQLLWVPGKKTIVDLGATKQIVPVTDEELLTQAAIRMFEVGGGKWQSQIENGYTVMRDALLQPRDIKLEIFGHRGQATFRYKDDKLVSQHTASELELLKATFDGQHGRWD